MSTQSLKVSQFTAVLLLDDVPAGAVVTNSTDGATVWVGDDPTLLAGGGIKLSTNAFMTTGARGPLYACLDANSPTATVIISTVAATVTSTVISSATLDTTTIFASSTFQRAGLDSPLLFDVHLYPSVMLRVDGDGGHTVSGWYILWLDSVGNIVDTAIISSNIAVSNSTVSVQLRTKGHSLAVCLNGSGSSVGFGAISVVGCSTPLLAQDDIQVINAPAVNARGIAPATKPGGKSFGFSQSLLALGNFQLAPASSLTGNKLNVIGGKYLVTATFDNQGKFNFGYTWGDGLLLDLNVPISGSSGNMFIFSNKDPRRCIGIDATAITDGLCFEIDLPLMVVQNTAGSGTVTQASFWCQVTTLSPAGAQPLRINMIKLGNGAYG